MAKRDYYEVLGVDRGADIARVFIAEMRSLANKTEAALEELT